MIRLRDVAALVIAAALTACGSSQNPSALLPLRSTSSSGTNALPAYTFVDLGAGPNGGPAVAFTANGTHQAGDYVFGRGSCGKDCSFNIYHALTWKGSGSVPVDITPPLINFVEAWAYGGSGSILVGTGVTNNGGYYGYYHALLWRGASFAWQDLNPSGDTESNAYATNGGAIAGSGASSSLHALLWSLSNLSNPTDLNPAGYTSSEALGLVSGKQVGYAVTSSSTPTQHAILWSGSASSAIDLTPSNVTGAYAYATNGTVQAGCGVVAPGTASHALLWRGTAASMKDLNPAAFTDSCVRAIHSGIQAGYGHVSGVLHALAWNGTANSALDLQTLLPGSYQQSQAFGFDSAGNIIGAAYSPSITGGWHAAMWIRQ